MSKSMSLVSPERVAQFIDQLLQCHARDGAQRKVRPNLKPTPAAARTLALSYGNDALQAAPFTDEPTGAGS